MILSEETFGGTWPFAPHFFEGSGFHQHYVDEGAVDDASYNVIVCVYGEPTRSYFYQHFIPRLSNLGRVVVLDHMGFGKSKTPQDCDYWVRDHADNLDQNFVRPWVNWIQNDQFEPTVSSLGATVLSVMKRIGFERAAQVDKTWVRAFATPFPTVEPCRGALQFPHSIGHPETIAFVEELAKKHDVGALKTISTMCVVVEEDRAMPSAWLKYRFKKVWPNELLILLPGVGLYLQEEAPEAVAALVDQFIQINSRPL